MSLRNGRRPPSYAKAVAAAARCAERIVRDAPCPDGGGVPPATIEREPTRTGLPGAMARQAIERAEADGAIYRTTSGFRVTQ